MQLTDWMQSAQARLWHSMQVIIAAVAPKSSITYRSLAVPEMPDAGEAPSRRQAGRPPR